MVYALNTQDAYAGTYACFINKMLYCSIAKKLHTSFQRVPVQRTIYIVLSVVCKREEAHIVIPFFWFHIVYYYKFRQYSMSSQL